MEATSCGKEIKIDYGRLTIRFCCFWVLVAHVLLPAYPDYLRSRHHFGNTDREVALKPLIDAKYHRE